MNIKKMRVYFNLAMIVFMAVITVVRYNHYMEQWWIYTVPWVLGFFDALWVLIPLIIGNLVFYFLLKRKGK